MSNKETYIQRERERETENEREREKRITFKEREDRSPSLVVMGGDSCSKSCEFE